MNWTLHGELKPFVTWKDTGKVEVIGRKVTIENVPFEFYLYDETPYCWHLCESTTGLSLSITRWNTPAETAFEALENTVNNIKHFGVKNLAERVAKPTVYREGVKINV